MSGLSPVARMHMPRWVLKKRIIKSSAATAMMPLATAPKIFLPMGSSSKPAQSILNSALSEPMLRLVVPMTMRFTV